MGLIDIFKGMADGPEAIQNNFMFGSVVESNLDQTNPADGYYVKFGNGLLVCMRTVPSNTTIQNSVNANAYKFAADFRDHPWVSYSVKEPANFRVHEFTDNVYIGVSLAEQEWRLRSRSGTSSIPAGLALIAVGIAAD